jgi:isopentenyl-diphosphate delta-isomerase
VELVVLLDDAGNAIGTAQKASVHHADTPLHLAFSCYVFDPAGRLLVTRRATTKATWPGVWTNSCCGHPAPGERLADAVVRRLRHELGIEVDDLDVVLPDFRYRATLDGVVENEICPVFRATTSAQPTPRPDEVDSTIWVPWNTFARGVVGGDRVVSPWCRLQVDRLTTLGPDPLRWPAGDLALLPPVAQPASELA